MPNLLPLINTGVSANDGTGTPYRTVAQNLNAAIGVQPYLGQVATGCRICTVQTNNNKQAQSRSPHTARDNITALKIVLPMWFMSQAYAETAVGGSITYTASVEYPAGTFTQITFNGGQVSVTPPDASQAVSDFVNVTIPTGARFWIRTFQQYGNPSTTAGGIIYSDCNDTVNGAEYNFAASGLTDLTMGGAITNTGGSIPASFQPMAIVAMTSKSTVMITGDSRGNGFKDTFDASGDLGEIARSIGPSLGYINASQSGDKLSSYITQNNGTRLRIALAQWVSHVICELGVNDAGNGGAYPAMRVNASALWQAFPSKRVWQTTAPPNPTSSDSFATLANQTPNTYEAARQVLNDWIRTKPDGLQGYFEVADVVESARNSGKWKVDGTAYKYTADGTHESPFAYSLIASSGAIDPTRLLR